MSTTRTPGIKRSAISGADLNASVIRAETETSPEEIEGLFREVLRSPMSQVAKIGEADIVVGIPFINETDTIGTVVRVTAQGLREYFPSKRCVIVTVGGMAGGEALEVVQSVPKWMGSGG